MSNLSLIAIQKHYDALDIPIEVSTVDDRILLQKSVYLSKKFEYDLGFCFGWYVQGPYSPELTTSMYELYNNLRGILREGKDYSVHPILLSRIDDLKSLMTVPTNVYLSKPEWLKLVSSIIYLKQKSYPHPDNIKEYLSNHKYFDSNKKLLRYYNIASTQIDTYL